MHSFSLVSLFNRLAVLSATAVLFAHCTHALTVFSTDPNITYSPSSSWDLLTTPGSTGTGSSFLLGPHNNGSITFTFPQPSTTFQWWGYQRSDGGVAQICIDGGACQDYSFSNASTNGSENPRLLANITGLSNSIHTIVMTNVEDPSVKAFGQMTVDRFVLDGNDPSGGSYIVFSTDSEVNYSPSSNWTLLAAPGSAGCGSEFLLGDRDNGVVTVTFPYPFTALQWWGYQRSDGGLAQLCIDSLPCSQFSYNNASTNGTENPRLLANITGLSNGIHTLTITNVEDPSVKAFGQLNVDRFVLSGSIPAPTFPSNTFISSVPLGFAYHAPMILGGNTPALNVLLATTSTNDWVVSDLCNSDSCAGHNKYVPGPGSQNSSIQDAVVFNNNAPENSTLVSWRVTDSLTWGNITTANTTLGAATEIPTGESLDGNFGMAKSAYAKCGAGNYNNFLENMFMQGDIVNAVMAFYQLDGSEGVPTGVSSQGSIGGLDANKFTGEVDWIQMDPQGQWQSPASQRVVQASSSSSAIDATDLFSHPVVTFDTAYGALLDLPHDDWLTLMSLVGAQGPDSNGNFLIPCNSTMTLNFYGSQNRNYTFDLANTSSDNGNGFCNPLASDAGSMPTWLAGTQFLDKYYMAFHYTANMMGFAERNLGASAAESTPFIS
ncbi:acid protease [Dacryopinax primogenitus]|uniref:Acid protease n=1 Tax=Dacryopinax primogenitus (strain DJM 731) TaxID=1858805 RepID=M5GDF5_DACPD|nr:acid protease [Dacryopinax primogenitus]EJU04492.1 acid protease [Dacryopinax primogenitus]